MFSRDGTLLCYHLFMLTRAYIYIVAVIVPPIGLRRADGPGGCIRRVCYWEAAGCGAGDGRARNHHGDPVLSNGRGPNPA